MNKLGRPHLMNITSYYRTTEVKAQGNTNQWTPAAQKQIIVYENILFMTKIEMQSSGERITSLINHAKPIWYHIKGKSKTGSLLHITHKINF